MRLHGILLAAGLLLIATRPGFAQMPAPKLTFDGVEKFEGGGHPFIRYKFKVTNAAAFTPELFTPAPKLPPCGLNANASRTWVDIYSGTTRLNSFCALANPADMNGLWFAVVGAQAPPPWVYITVTDRQTNDTVTSNPVTIPSK